MKFQQLPSTFDSKGVASARQHLACFVINDSVSIDAGSLAMATTDLQKEKIRDIVLTHAHLDHVAGLPLFIDDLFATLTEPIRIHAVREVVETLEKHIFNWEIYPRFSELSNVNGSVVEYKIIENNANFSISDLNFKPIKVNHKVPSVGFIVSDKKTTIAISSDTSKMDGFWDEVNSLTTLQAILIECAFPDELQDLADASHHLTPMLLMQEMEKCKKNACPIYVINIKPMYREKVILQLEKSKINNLQILEAGKIYEF